MPRIEPLDQAAAYLALQSLQESVEGIAKKLHPAADRVGMALNLVPKDHVKLLKTIAPIRFAALAGDTDGTHQAASALLERLAQQLGTTPAKLRTQVQEAVNTKITEAKHVALKAPAPQRLQAGVQAASPPTSSSLIMGSDGRDAYVKLMGMVGQHRAKEQLAEMLQRAQLARMVQGVSANVVTGPSHIQIRGEAGSGKSTWLRHLAPILKDAGQIKQAKVHVTSGINFSGQNEGEINEKVAEAFAAAKDGLLVIDEIQGLNGRDQWSHAVYGRDRGLSNGSRVREHQMRHRGLSCCCG